MDYISYSPFSPSWSSSSDDDDVRSPKKEQEIEEVEEVEDIFINKDISNPLGIKLYNFLNKSEKAMKLIEAVNKKGKVAINFRSEKEMRSKNTYPGSTSFSAADVEFGDDGIDRISICRDSTFFGQVSALLFELGNVKRKEKLLHIEKCLDQGKLSSGDDYALAKEAVEHFTALEYDKIIKDSVAAKSWSKEMIKYLINEKDDIYEAIATSKETGHYDYYVKQYNEFVADRAKLAEEEILTKKVTIVKESIKDLEEISPTQEKLVAKKEKEKTTSTDLGSMPTYNYKTSNTTHLYRYAPY